VALTKVGKEGVTGISNSSNATAITIDSSERVGIGTTSPTALLTMVAADGVMADQYVAKFTNSEATAGQNYGVFVAGGSTSADESFSVRKFDNSATYFKVRGDGNVSIGHASPTAPLDVRRGDAAGVVAEFHNTSGFGVDIGTDSDSVAYVSGGYTQALTFKTNAGSGQVERMRILSNGFVLIATSTSGGEGYSFGNTGFLTHARASGGAQSMVGYKNGSNFVGEIRTSTSATSYITSSDYRLKENVTYDWDATTRLKQLKPARFNFIIDPDKTVDGFLAHEVTAVPEAISGTKDEVEVWKDGEELPDGVSVGDNKLDADGNTIPVMQGIDQSKLVPLLVKTIIELEARIAALEAE